MVGGGGKTAIVNYFLGDLESEKHKSPDPRLQVQIRNGALGSKQAVKGLALPLVDPQLQSEIIKA